MVFLPKKKKIPVGKEIRKTAAHRSEAAHKRVVEMDDTITVQDLANQLSVKAVGCGPQAHGHGPDGHDQPVDRLRYGDPHRGRVSVRSEERRVQGRDAHRTPTEDKPSRPLSLVLRSSRSWVTSTTARRRFSTRSAKPTWPAGEAGGITQHIGAYTVEKNGKLITFIDTPGHEAFTVMRARGANVTDIVILVVSADDGVMPQTREASSHAQAAKRADHRRGQQDRQAGRQSGEDQARLWPSSNLLAEDWGGDTMFVPVSALKKTNLDKLLDAILLQAEVLDLKANPDARANGTVLEARLEKGRGPVVSVLVNRGTLRVGDPIVSGPHAGKVKAMMDDKGRSVKEVTPGIAAEVLGFEGVPNAGEKFNATDDRSRCSRDRRKPHRQEPRQDLGAAAEGHPRRSLLEGPSRRRQGAQRRPQGRRVRLRRSDPRQPRSSSRPRRSRSR